MKIKLNKYISVLGFLLIISAFVIVAVKSYTIDAFSTIKHRDLMAPAGDIMKRNKEKFSFAVISDTGAMDETIERMIRIIRLTDAKFILHLGDLVRYKNASHFRWIADEVDGELSKIPFYIVPGNHDIYNQKGKIDKSSYKTVFGQTYYWFSYGDVLFIGLDSSTGKLDKKQLRWLETTLNEIRHDYKFCVIYTHYPPINVMGENHKRRLDGASVKEFSRIIKGQNISLIFAGHVHYFSESEFEEVPLITVPASGQPPRGDVKKFGFVKVDVAKDEIKKPWVQYVKLKKDSSGFMLFMSNAFVKQGIGIVAIFMFALGVVLVIIGFILKRKG